MVKGLCFAALLAASALGRPQMLPRAATGAPQALKAEDRKYLQTLAKNTWHCIAGLANPATGLPYDNLTHGEFTSVSNIGLYLSSVVAARHMGFIGEREATSDWTKRSFPWTG